MSFTYDAVIRINSKLLEKSLLSPREQHTYNLLIQKLSAIQIEDDVDLGLPSWETDNWLYYRIEGLSRSSERDLQQLEKQFSSSVFSVVHLKDEYAIDDAYPLIAKTRVTLVVAPEAFPRSPYFGPPDFEFSKRTSSDGYEIWTGDLTRIHGKGILQNQKKLLEANIYENPYGLGALLENWDGSVEQLGAIDVQAVMAREENF